MTRRRQVVSLSILVIFCLIIWQLYSSWHRYTTTPILTGNQPVKFVLTAGTPIKRFAKDLYQEGIIKHPKLFVLMARLKNATRKIQAGQYEVTPTTTPKQLLQKLIDGKVILRELTIVEGWTFSELMAAMDKNAYLVHSLKNKTPKEVMAAIGHSGQSPEGLFYPDTYLFGAGVNDVEILRKSYQRMADLLQADWKGRATDLPYKNVYQALIAASLIQRETSFADEKPKIAGVIVRRLKRGMRLQIDPTVIYALGKKYNGKITREDLKVKSPYNTYINKGLPPTPIAFPDSASIYAALHPDKGKALYFVAKGDGSHVFSDTLAAHDAAIRKYLLNKPMKEKQSSKKQKLRVYAMCYSIDLALKGAPRVLASASL